MIQAEAGCKHGAGLGPLGSCGSVTGIAPLAETCGIRSCWPCCKASMFARIASCASSCNFMPWASKKCCKALLAAGRVLSTGAPPGRRAHLANPIARFMLVSGYEPSPFRCPWLLSVGSLHPESRQNSCGMVIALQGVKVLRHSTATIRGTCLSSHSVTLRRFCWLSGPGCCRSTLLRFSNPYGSQRPAKIPQEIVCGRRCHGWAADLANLR